MTQEEFFSEYQDKDGLMVAHRIILHQDGRQIVDAECNDYRRFENLDDAIFAMP